MAGFVFQDPYTSELWPRFSQHLEYCEVEYQERGFPKIRIDRGDTKREHPPFMQIPPGDLPPVSRPTPRQIISAVSDHRSGSSRDAELSAPDEESAGASLPVSAAHIERVSFVEDEPTPVYLTTYLYLPKPTFGETDWYACDPFGNGVSVRLRRWIEQVARQERPLDKKRSLGQVLDKLVPDAGGRRPEREKGERGSR